MSTRHLVTVGWDATLIEGLCEPIAQRIGCEFSHLMTTPPPSPLLPRGALLKPQPRHLPPADLEYLAHLERMGEPTIRTMIASDRVLSRRDPDFALRYTSFLAKWLRQELERKRPDVVIGGFDSVHAGIGRAVAHSLQIPWFAMHFSVLPRGLAAFCTGLTPDTVVPMGSLSAAAAADLADRTLREFKRGTAAVPAYVSSTSVRLMMDRIPKQARHLVDTVRHTAALANDPSTQLTPRELVAQWLRKRRNALRLGRTPLRTSPPDGPYIFFGLHMQPESSIDTWAPFYADQFAVVEAIARATPASHRFLVKLHRSAADAYSARELARFCQLPGVELVAPAISARPFIERAALICTIQGSMGLEAALLGRQVLQFGDSPVLCMPSVRRAGRITDLPDEIRELVQAEPPSAAGILAGFTEYLGKFSKACFNDWTKRPDETEMADLASLFDTMLESLRRE